MTEIGLIRYASGDWTPGNPYVRVRIEADELEEPQDLSIALSDVGAFVTLLLALSGKAGIGGQPGAVAEKAFPLPVDSVGLGHTETGETILQLGIGQTTLAFAMLTKATAKHGQSPLAMTASTVSNGANWRRNAAARAGCEMSGRQALSDCHGERHVRETITRRVLEVIAVSGRGAFPRCVGRCTSIYPEFKGR